jgi:hypothetical protein
MSWRMLFVFANCHHFTSAEVLDERLGRATDLVGLVNAGSKGIGIG